MKNFIFSILFLVISNSALSEDRVFFIENDKMKLGISLSAGGGIFYLGFQKGENLLNFHEFKNVELGWEKSIPFSEGFRCYSSKLEHIRFAIDDGIEKQVNGQGAGNFSWSAK